MGEWEIRERTWRVCESTLKDAAYQELEKEAAILEQQLKAYEDVVPAYVLDIIQEYLAKCVEMNWRAVEIACGIAQEVEPEK